MSSLAIIGGSGFTRWEDLKITGREVISTPYGEPSAPVIHGLFNNHEVIFLPRHGAAHTIPPHQVNYRANIWALKQIGVERIIGVAAVGGIEASMAPGVIAIPDQIIDYTWGREHTFFEYDLSHVTHIDFTQPYCSSLRQELMQAAKNMPFHVIEGGTYGATQGPRLETAQEINRLERDGCDIVGMTGMPEAALAKELGLCYASCAVVANWAAGRDEGPITMDEIERHLGKGLDRARRLLGELVATLK
ncbi:MAG: S-methyl-5'-thioinosine phosphorylase [Gammaproteobacteria bacterium]|nr:S-methyl-5'-thioinosine phosphorylase [Gammaproteobacteria bacterium]